MSDKLNYFDVYGYFENISKLKNEHRSRYYDNRNKYENKISNLQNNDNPSISIYSLIFNNPQLNFVGNDFERIKIDLYFKFIPNIIKKHKKLLDEILSPNNKNYEDNDLYSIQLFKFRLKTPYISHDDEIFYPIDNPTRKDWVFKVPYIAPSQWKGMLRHVAISELVSKIKNNSISDDEIISKRLTITLLFGNENELPDLEIKPIEKNKDNFLDHECSENVTNDFWKIIKRKFPKGSIRGCLSFFPTFFDKIGLDVINPHDRETGAGTMPIFYEVVPAGTEGELKIVCNKKLFEDYKSKIENHKSKIDGSTIKIMNCEDYLKKLVESLFNKYGIGAKTTSGYGSVSED